MKNKKENQSTFLFNKQNYILMIVGVLFIITGFLLMAGGGSEDPHVFDEGEVYSFRRITLAPIVVIIGFIIEVVAIMRKPRDKMSNV